MDEIKVIPHCFLSRKLLFKHKQPLNNTLFTSPVVMLIYLDRPTCNDMKQLHNQRSRT